MSITDAQLRFFNVFGYLKLPGVLASEIGWITEEFETVWATAPRTGFDGNGEPQNAIVPFVDQSAKLCTLVDHPLLKPALVGILGEDYNYLASDGRPYSGDTGWHPDGNWGREALFLKVAFYLDPLTRSTGALRVIPGSHRLPDSYANEVREAMSSDKNFGIPMSEVPAVALETTPGDVVIFNHNTMHSSFGGGHRRRMFTMNLGRHADTPELEQLLVTYLGIHNATWGSRTHGELMRATATASRWRHLEQVIKNEGHLVALRKQIEETAAANRAKSLATVAS